MLLLLYPQILKFDEVWVDILFESEQNIRNRFGATCLMYLFQAKNLPIVNFQNMRFMALLNN